MNEWKCPIEDIDEDIREAVSMVYESGMKPYISCSGSYKDHKGKSYLPETAGIELLDSELTRELIATLINDKRFKCSISKERGRMIYDNDIPTGLRFKINFENVCGDIGPELNAIIKSVIEGKKADLSDRKKVDMVCSMIDMFDVSRGNKVEFSFNDEMVIPGKEDKENFSIEIQDRKDFEEFGKSISHAVDDFTQDESECKFYGSDFLSMLSVIKKIRMDYYKIKKLNKGERPSIVKGTSQRINRFTKDYNKKIEEAKEKLESNGDMFKSEDVSIDDLMSFFGDDDGQK